MKKCTVSLVGISPYSCSRKHDTPELHDKEGKDEYEKRTWMEKCHYYPDTLEMYIPQMAFKLALDRTAKYLQISIPGKGKALYTKNFGSGVMVTQDLALGINYQQVPGEWFYVHSNGQRGSGSRVKRCFPMLRKWGGEVEFTILDDTITEEVFERVLNESGVLTGVGRFRPEMQGINGRYKIESTMWNNNY